MPMYQMTLIGKAAVMAQQDVELNDDESAENEMFDGMDPLQMAREGKPVTWVEARYIHPVKGVRNYPVGSFTDHGN